MAVLTRVARRLLQRGSIVAALFMFAATWAPAQDANAAFQIKAAFVQKFATYVTGPGTGFEANDGSALVFGIAGSDSVYDFLMQLAAAQSSGRPTEVRRIASVEDLAGVDVLFVGEEASDVPVLLQRAVAASTLTITDVAGPQPANSMIHFFVADDRVRFDVALAPAAAAGLRLSSRLLQVARQVTDE